MPRTIPPPRPRCAARYANSRLRAASVIASTPGMREPTLGGDDVVAFAHGVGDADPPHAVEPADVVRDGGGRRKHVAGGLPDDGHQGRVLELADDARPDPHLVEPLLERAPQRAVRRRQQQRRVVQRRGEAPLQPRRERRRGEEGGVGLAEQVIEDLHRQVGGRRRVGDDDVERIARQLAHELLRVVLAAHHADGVGLLQRRPDQPVDDQLRHGVGHADGERHGALAGPSLERVDQVAADAEDVVGVLIHDAPDIGQRLHAPLPGEERLADGGLERPHLRADRGLRQVQLFGGLRHAALADDGPEIEEVVIVQPVHG